MTSPARQRSHCLATGRPFVSYRLPGALEAVTLAASPAHVRTVTEAAELDGRDGFLFAPFERGSAPAVFLEAAGATGTPAPPADAAGGGPSLPRALERAEYLDRVRRVLASIEAGEIRKVVISRVQRVAEVALKALPALFDALCARHPEALVYLFSSPQTGTWIGATPELLVELAGGRFRTMALAATRRAGAAGDPAAWNEKERREQALVADYLRDRLRELGLPLSESPVCTHSAGHLAHLSTIFEGRVADASRDRARLVDALHPNPAIAGVPADRALALIRDLETGPRTYYAGYLGPWRANGDATLYSNLRCARHAGEALWAFAGGGILRDSTPEDEWEETCGKLESLAELAGGARAGAVAAAGSRP